MREALRRAKGRIRSLLGHALGWRVTPEILFEIDTTTDEAERIARALEDVPPTIGVAKDEFGYPLEDKTHGIAEDDADVGTHDAKGVGPDEALEEA